MLLNPDFNQVAATGLPGLTNKAVGSILHA
jgi:hypothetical protein